jgi:hypothetical protein
MFQSRFISKPPAFIINASRSARLRGTLRIECRGLVHVWTGAHDHLHLAANDVAAALLHPDQSATLNTSIEPNNAVGIAVG